MKEKESLWKKKNDFNPILLQQMEGTRRDEIEEQNRKKDINTLKEKMEKNLPEVVMQMNKSRLSESLRKRAKIIMPDPQISDQEISEISKTGYVSEEDNGNEATKMLISNYMPTPSLQTPMQGQNFITERTPSRPDTIMLEAQRLKNLTSQSTPLIPGDNEEMPDFNDPNTGKQDFKTPSPLLLKLRTPMENNDNMTPGVMGTPRKTPFRDQFNINTENDIQTRIKLKEEKEKLKLGLGSLPEPKREIQIVVPELPEDFDSMDIDRGSSSNLEDEAEREKKINSLRQAKKDAQLRLRSQVLRRNLPRPFKVNAKFSKTEKEIEELKNTNEYIPELLKYELNKMMINDSITYPTKNNLPTKVSKNTWKYEEYTEDELKVAKSLLHKETQSLIEENEKVSFDEYETTWTRCQEDLIYLPHKKKFNLNSNSMSQNDKLPALEYQYENLEKDLKRQEKKAVLGEKKK